MKEKKIFKKKKIKEENNGKKNGKKYMKI